jgi:putative copper resistance protein D
MYFTGLYAAAAPLHWAHLVMNAHFVLMGYAYFWIIIGVDPTPHRLSYPARLGLLMAAVPFHVLFGVSLTATTTLLGGEFYRALALPFVPDLLADQRIGGVLAWSVGELPLLVVLVVLLVQWTRAGEAARRLDRDHDAVDGAAAGEDTILLARTAPGDWAPEPGALRD